jgi:hypothetical protein
VMRPLPVAVSLAGSGAAAGENTSAPSLGFVVFAVVVFGAVSTTCARAAERSNNPI